MINAANRLGVIVRQRGVLRARHVCQHDELTGRRIAARPTIIRSGPGLRTSERGHGGPGTLNGTVTVMVSGNQ
jgi:hypothetical protein